MSYHAAIKAAFEEARSAKEELKALYDGAESRSLEGEEVAKESAIHESITAAEARMSTLIEHQEASDKAEEAYRSADIDGAVANASANSKGDERSDSDYLRAIASGELRSHNFEARDDVNLAAGAATDGAEVVPTTLFGQLTAYMRENATVMNNRGRQINTASGEDLVMPKVTSYSVASIVAESATIGKDAPQFDTVTMGAFKYGCLVVMSNELLTDSGFNIVPFVSGQGGEALARGIGAHLIAGTGSGQPNGVFTAAATGVTAAGATEIVADELIDLQHSVASPYRANATWICKDSTLKLIRKLKDGDNQYLWRPGLIAGHPDTILGNPVVTDDSAPEATTGLDSVLYGDLNGYAVRMVGSVRVTRSDEYAYDSDMVAWRFLARADGDLIDTNAVKVLTQG